jgi:hypothetical protein
VTSPPDDRSPVAVAASWASRLITVSLEMVLPGVGGLWVDGRLGTTPLLTLLGFGFGLTWGIWHLIRMTQASDSETPCKGDPHNGD